MLSTRPVAGDQKTAQAPAPAKFRKLALARCNAGAQSRGWVRPPGCNLLDINDGTAYAVSKVIV